MSRSNSFRPKLSFMTDQEFEDEAALLLAEFGRKHGTVPGPPIPIDEIVELYLELELELLDMKVLFGVDDVHGALWVNERRVGIDQRFDPHANPKMLGRYHFTLAHEAGHWRLHRKLFQRRANQPSLLPKSATRPEFICRSSDREPIEIQADKFAAALMMPKEFIKRSWHEFQGDMEPIFLDDLKSGKVFVAASGMERRLHFKTGPNAEDDALLECAAQPMADRFEVSAPAMRNRLESMKLLIRKRERTLFD